MDKGTCTIRTDRQMTLIDITHLVTAELQSAKIDAGICMLFNPHTTAGLTINEGADPDVQTDIITGLRQMVPLDHPFRHREGNSPAHIMATLTGSSVLLPVARGQLQLGTWQRIFFCEFDGPRTRTFHWQML